MLFICGLPGNVTALSVLIKSFNKDLSSCHHCSGVAGITPGFRVSGCSEINMHPSSFKIYWRFLIGCAMMFDSVAVNPNCVL